MSFRIQLRKAVTGVSVLIAVSGLGQPVFSGVEQQSDVFWMEQFNELSRQIDERSGTLGKVSAAPGQKVLDDNALVLGTDRDPADVILRRTGALLSEYAKRGGTADWKAFADRLSALKERHAATAPAHH